MACLKTVVTLFLLAISLPCAARCSLERAGILNPPPCCEKHDCDSENIPVSCGNCDSVASGYHGTDTKVQIPAVFTLLLPFQMPSEASIESEDVRFVPKEDPIPIPNIFQFTSRTALPVRAPSFLS